MVLAFTGHRPEKLPWGNDETDPRCAALKVQIKAEIRRQIHQGVEDFCCGMARGCDFYFAEAVLQLRADMPQIRLHAYLPCESQSHQWHQSDRERYQDILSRCDGVYLLQKAYTPSCMTRRNRLMVDDADVLMSVWDGSVGGTGATVRYGVYRNKRLLPLWL